MKSIYYQDDIGRIHLKLLNETDKTKQFALFLHGASPKSQNTEFWTPIHEIIVRNINPIYMDRFGHGQSETEKKVVLNDHLRSISGVIEFICNEYDIETIVLIGRSLGGGMATRIAKDHTDRIKTLGLIAPASLKTNAKNLKDWRKPISVLWDSDDNVVKFENYNLVHEVTPQVKLFVIGEVDKMAEIKVPRKGIKKGHAPELAAPNLFEKFLISLIE
jgi:esterase/lipase